MNENEKKEKRKKIKDEIGWYLFCFSFLLVFLLFFINWLIYASSEKYTTVDKKDITYSANVDVLKYKRDKLYSVSYTRLGKVYSFSTDTIYISDDEEDKVTFNLKTVKKYNNTLLFGEFNEIDDFSSVENIEKAIEKGKFRVEVTAETYKRLTSAE